MKKTHIDTFKDGSAALGVVLHFLNAKEKQILAKVVLQNISYRKSKIYSLQQIAGK